MSMATTHTGARTVVKTVLRLRFYQTIRPYFGGDLIPFCHILRQVGVSSPVQQHSGL
jgi:hypothetical protein